MVNTAVKVSSKPNRLTYRLTGDGTVGGPTIPNATILANCNPGPLRDSWNAVLTTQAAMRDTLLGGLDRSNIEGCYAIVQSLVLPAAVAGAGIEDYGYFYNNAISATVAIDAPFPFDTDGPNTGVGSFLHTASPVVATSAPITIVKAGTYMIEWTVGVTEARQVSLWLDGAIVLSTVLGGATGTTTTTGIAILTVTAGQVLTLRNGSSAAALTLTPTAGGTRTSVTNSIVIKRLGVGGETAADGNQIAVDVDTDAVSVTKAEINITMSDSPGQIALLHLIHPHSVIA